MPSMQEEFVNILDAMMGNKYYATRYPMLLKMDKFFLNVAPCPLQ
jgi:hypothetical protein